MGSCRYERIPAVPNATNNVFEFDSSHDRAIAKKYGYELGSVELKEVDANPRRTVYEVSARGARGENDPQKPLMKVGRLTVLTKDEILRRQDAGPYHGGSWT